MTRFGVDLKEIDADVPFVEAVLIHGQAEMHRDTCAVVVDGNWKVNRVTSRRWIHG